jgi:hypothetical protein
VCEFAGGRPLPGCFFWWVATPIRFFSNGAATGKNEGPAGKATQSIKGVFFETIQNVL